MREDKRYVGILFLICFVASLLVSIVYALTYSRIEEREKRQLETSLETSLKEMFPEAAQIEELSKDGFIYYRAINNNDEVLGYILICEAVGYSSTIKAIVSTETNGKIKEIKILEQNETLGIGSKITEEEFLSRFKEKSKDDTFDTITGATISSKAIIKAVKESLKKIFP
ncbi:MAG: FMN-binding protein [Candidatus Omnitrophica bacterium]|nr:FMN-binding protein [Candidatus Omnitrophota bacterium]MCM8799165.1 FMN-binding protein [Candidatus Omnitrophota bacterium]